MVYEITPQMHQNARFEEQQEEPRGFQERLEERLDERLEEPEEDEEEE